MDILDIMMAKKLSGGGSGLPSVEGSGKALVSVNGEWVKQDGYGHYKGEIELLNCITNEDGFPEDPVSFINLKSGEFYSIIFDGVRYDNIQCYDEGEGALFVELSLEEEYGASIFIYNYGDVISIRDHGNHTIKLLGSEYATINPNYLPEGGFGYEKKLDTYTVSWNGDVNDPNNLIVEIHGIPYVCIQPDSDFFDPEILISKENIVTLCEDDVEKSWDMPCYALDPDGWIQEEGAPNYVLGDNSIFFLGDGSSAAWEIEGLDWGFYLKASDDFKVLALKMDYNIVYKIDAKFLPVNGNIATEDYVNQQIAEQDTEAWTFTLDDDTTVTKQVVVKS